MKNGKDVSVVFMEEAMRTGKVLGYKKTTEILINLRSADPASIFNGSVELIVNEVLLEFKMTKQQLLGRNDNSRLARRFCYVLLKEHMCVDVDYLSRCFGREKPTIWEELRAFKSLDKENRVDVNVLAQYEKISKKVNLKLSK